MLNYNFICLYSLDQILAYQSPPLPVMLAEEGKRHNNLLRDSAAVSQQVHMRRSRSENVLATILAMTTTKGLFSD